MTDLSLCWKKNDYVVITGTIDESADFNELLAKRSGILFVDFKNVQRINSSGVRRWVQAVAQLNQVEIHYMNCSCPVVEQLSMVPEFLGRKNTVESFDARYVCENCNYSHIFNLVVGFDVKAGLQKYDDGPERFCPKCNSKMEFDHNPDSYLYFLTKLPKTKNA